MRSGSAQAVAVGEVCAIAAVPASTLDNPDAGWELLIELKSDKDTRSGGLTEQVAKKAIADFMTAELQSKVGKS